jgi:hypothetical protein
LLVVSTMPYGAPKNLHPKPPRSAVARYTRCRNQEHSLTKHELKVEKILTRETFHIISHPAYNKMLDNAIGESH